MKSGIVVVYSSNNCDFRRSQTKLTKMTSEMTSDEVKIKQIDIVVIKQPLVLIKLIIKTFNKWYCGDL